MIFDLSHRREQAVLGVWLAQHRLFRPVRSKPAKNPGQTPFPSRRIVHHSSCGIMFTVRMPNQSYPAMMNRGSLKLLMVALACPVLGVALVLAGCAAPAATPTPAIPSPASATAAVSDTVVLPTAPPMAPTGTPEPSATPGAVLLTLPAGVRIQLSLWTVEAISPQAEGEVGPLFADMLRGFERAYPGVSVSVVLKNTSGRGSVLDYLRTASVVAPSVLPDLVVLDTADLAAAARTGVLVPLDGEIAADLVADLLPAARAAGTVHNQLLGIPFQMDVEHLIYNANQVSSVPLTWTDVLSAHTTLLFPAKGRNGLVNDAFTIQYLSLGGRFQDDEGGPLLDEPALRAVLGYYQQAAQAGVLMREAALQAGDAQDVWSVYVSARAGLAQVTAHRFLTGRQALRNTRFGDIPTRDGHPLTIGRGHLLAVLARDPLQQSLAMRLVEWWLRPDNNSVWNQTTHYLPTRYAAFQLWGNEDPYYPFLQHLLEIAVPAPPAADYDPIARVLQQAVLEVLRGESTPEQAAAAAVDAIVR